MITAKIQAISNDACDLNHKSYINDIKAAYKLKNQVGLISALTSYLESGKTVLGLSYDSKKTYEDNFRIISKSFYEKCKGSAKSPWLEELIKNL